MPLGERTRSLCLLFRQAGLRCQVESVRFAVCSLQHECHAVSMFLSLQNAGCSVQSGAEAHHAAGDGEDYGARTAWYLRSFSASLRLVGVPICAIAR